MPTKIKPNTRFILLREPKSMRKAHGEATAILKSIDGQVVAQPLTFVATAKLSHLVPLVDYLTKNRKKRRRANGKHPTTEDGAEKLPGKAAAAPKRIRKG